MLLGVISQLRTPSWAGLAVTGLLSHHMMPCYPYWPSCLHLWAIVQSSWQTCSAQCCQAGQRHCLLDHQLQGRQSSPRQLVTQNAGSTLWRRCICQAPWIVILKHLYDKTIQGNLRRLMQFGWSQKSVCNTSLEYGQCPIWRLLTKKRSSAIPYRSCCICLKSGRIRHKKVSHLIAAELLENCCLASWEMPWAHTHVHVNLGMLWIFNDARAPDASKMQFLQAQHSEDSSTAVDHLAKSLLLENLLPQCLTSSKASCEAARKLLIATTTIPSSAGSHPAPLSMQNASSYDTYTDFLLSLCSLFNKLDPCLTKQSPSCCTKSLFTCLRLQNWHSVGFCLCIISANRASIFAKNLMKPRLLWGDSTWLYDSLIEPSVCRQWHYISSPRSPNQQAQRGPHIIPAVRQWTASRGFQAPGAAHPWDGW